MADKPSFLIRGPVAIRRHFNRIGIKLNSNKQAGTADPITSNRYKQLSDRLKDASTIKRHQQWLLVYKSAYDAAYDDAQKEGLKEKPSKKKARQQAELEVVDQFPKEVTTTRAMRNALSLIHD